MAWVGNINCSLQSSVNYIRIDNNNMSLTICWKRLYLTSQYYTYAFLYNIMFVFIEFRCAVTFSSVVLRLCLLAGFTLYKYIKLPIMLFYCCSAGHLLLRCIWRKYYFIVRCSRQNADVCVVYYYLVCAVCLWRCPHYLSVCQFLWLFVSMVFRNV